MTARDIYEATIVEINKEDSQSFSIEEFNYILNKSILAFTNEKYNFYAVNQQASDDLRTLIKSQTFNIHDVVDITLGDEVSPTFNSTTSHILENITDATSVSVSSLQDISNTDVITIGDSTTQHTINNIVGNVISFSPMATAEIGSLISIATAPIIVTDVGNNVPRTLEMSFSSSDYLHLISCRVSWLNSSPIKSGTAQLMFPAKRLTYDMLNAIQNNTYLKPAPNRPYYQLLNHHKNSGVISLPSALVDYKAHQNRPKIRMHVGNRNNNTELRQITFDYIKIPEIVTLKDSDVFSAGADPSQVLELPDYLMNEIVKRCTGYFLERVRDPRMQTQPVFNQEIPKIPINMSLSTQQIPQDK